jgi:hypothetical protein
MLMSITAASPHIARNEIILSQSEYYLTEPTLNVVE